MPRACSAALNAKRTARRLPSQRPQSPVVISRFWLLVILTLVGAFATSRACARGAETCAQGFFATATTACPESEPQVAGTHQGFAACGYESASGYSQAAEDQGIVYLRTNPETGEEYVGQAKSPERFDARQGEHDSDLGVEHDYEILGRANPGIDLDALEETMIRENGGIQKEGGTLANKRHQMSNTRYNAYLDGD
jgi:hypothetical protein